MSYKQCASGKCEVSWNKDGYYCDFCDTKFISEKDDKFKAGLEQSIGAIANSLGIKTVKKYL